MTWVPSLPYNFTIAHNSLNANQNSPVTSVKKLTLSNQHKTLSGHLNVNSLRKKLNDDDDDDELFFVVWLTNERRLALFPVGTIVKDPHHRESPTRHEQGLNLRRTLVQT